jgi:hypothetical protein
MSLEEICHQGNSVENGKSLPPPFSFTLCRSPPFKSIRLSAARAQAVRSRLEYCQVSSLFFAGETRGGRRSLPTLNFASKAVCLPLRLVLVVGCEPGIAAVLFGHCRGPSMLLSKERLVALFATVFLAWLLGACGSLGAA